MIYLSIVNIILGGALMIIGLAVRGGSELIMKFPEDKYPDQEAVHRYVGNDVLVLGLVGLIAGLATLTGGEDNILIFLAYIVFVVLFIALIRFAAKTYEKKI